MYTCPVEKVLQEKWNIWWAVIPSSILLLIQRQNKVGSLPNDLLKNIQRTMSKKEWCLGLLTDSTTFSPTCFRIRVDPA